MRVTAILFSVPWSSADLSQPFAAGITASGRSRTGRTFATATSLLKKLHAAEAADSSLSDDPACQPLQKRLCSLFPKLPTSGALVTT